MARLVSALVLFLAIGAGVYQFYVKSLLTIFGVGRVVESIGNKKCTTVPELQACDKIVLHQPTGLLYLACSTPQSRTFWNPAAGRLNASAASRDDFVATYDPASGRVTRLALSGFSSLRGLSLQGMDVVPSSSSSSSSSSSPGEVFVYLVNHRAPLGRPAEEVGADSAVEVFRGVVGGTELVHVRTVEDAGVVITPNDVVGDGEGKGFYFTNDHAEKVGLLRELDPFGRQTSSVGYCHLDSGCKFAITGMHSSNGIAQALNGTVYVGSSANGRLSILERQSDDTLVLTEVIKTDRGMDNLSIDSEGHVWAAGFPNVLHFIFVHIKDPSIPTPSSALRFSINTGPKAFYGEKYKVFEDDGSIASGVSSVAYDAQRKRLFMHGFASPRLAVCEL